MCSVATHQFILQILYWMRCPMKMRFIYRIFDDDYTYTQHLLIFSSLYRWMCAGRNRQKILASFNLQRVCIETLQTCDRTRNAFEPTRNGCYCFRFKFRKHTNLVLFQSNGSFVLNTSDPVSYVHSLHVSMGLFVLKHLLAADEQRGEIRKVS